MIPIRIAIVSDASPLIYFAKMDKLAFLVQVVGTIAIPPSVYKEAVEAGRRRGRLDADRIAAAIKERMVVRLEPTAQEVQLTGRLSADPRLGAGECEVIACAAHRRLKALLHDKKARRVAASYGVRTIQAADVLFLALLRRHVSLSEFKSLLRDLAVLIGMDTATLLEREALAEEIAYQLKLQE
jgi:predicted nucleic acid-binding protein